MTEGMWVCEGVRWAMLTVLGLTSLGLITSLVLALKHLK